jgi:predicted RNA-binding Zn-ribbon protein involved in translation (DUF1610 family)
VSSILSGINKETVAFIIGGCFLIGISTQFDEPYRTISFATGLIMIPLSFVWDYMENRFKRKERQELQQKVHEQLERMKVKCPKCGQLVIPRKVGEMFLCPNCSHQFKSTKQIIEEWKKGMDVASEFIDFLSSLEE